VIRPTVLNGALAAGAIALVSCVQACSATPDRSEAPASSASSVDPSPGIHVLVLGDSIATTNACPGCTGFPDLYGQAIGDRTGSDVEVENLAVPDTGVADLRSQVQASGARQALADADVVVVTIGFNDTPWNRIDDPCRVAPNYPIVLWDQITDKCISDVTKDYAKGLDAVLDTVGQVAPEGSALRVVGVYNSTLGDHVDSSWDSPESVAPSIAGNAAFDVAQRAAAEQHGGVFVDMVEQINGPGGRRGAGTYLAADYTHLSQSGHELTARALTLSGWED
jgi:lysophospholipase L1-like esterase